MHNVSDADFALRLLLALGLRSSIGFERQLRHHEAGLKINALVAAGFRDVRHDGELLH